MLTKPPTRDGCAPVAPPSAARRALCLGGAPLLIGTMLHSPAHARRQPDQRPRADVAALDAAIVNRDQSRLDSLIEDELLWIRGSGAVGGKSDFIRGLTNPDLSIEPFLPSRTRLFADGVLELWTGVNELRGVSGGEPFVDRHHFADLWRLSGGGWRLAFIQVTAFPQPAAEP